MAIIHKYEVEMKLTYKSSGVSRVITSLQHAYSVGDACMQAGYTIVDIESVKVQVLRVGPPLEDIRKQETSLPQLISDAVDEALQKMNPIGLATDAVATEGCKATTARKI